MNPYEPENHFIELPREEVRRIRHIPRFVVVAFLTLGILIGFALVALGFASLNPFRSISETFL